MMTRYKIDISGFVETNLRWNPTQINHAKALLRTHHKNASFLATNSDETSTIHINRAECVWQ